MTRGRLLPHPVSAAAWPGELTAELEWHAIGSLRVGFRAEGDVAALSLPSARNPEHADGLWRTTCFEMFLMPAGEAAYVEINLSPSGAWAFYRFDGYRRGMRALRPLHPPKIVCRLHTHVLEVEAEVALEGLELGPGSGLSLGLSAVLEEHSGRVSWWALAHPCAEPDFHDARGFVLRPGRPRCG